MRRKRGSFSKQKGKRGERKIVGILQKVIYSVYPMDSKPTAPFLERNQNQSNEGGTDIVGIPWLAIEVKNAKVLQIDKWWEQTLAQAVDKQTPVLFFKRGITIKVMTIGVLWFGHWYQHFPVEVSLHDFLIYFEARLRYERLH